MYFFNMYKLVTHLPYNTLQSYQFNELKGQLKKALNPRFGEIQEFTNSEYKTFKLLL